MRPEVEVRKNLQDLAVKLIGAIAIKDNRDTSVATKGIRKLTLEIAEIGKEYRKVTSPKATKEARQNKGEK